MTGPQIFGLLLVLVLTATACGNSAEEPSTTTADVETTATTVVTTVVADSPAPHRVEVAFTGGRVMTDESRVSVDRGTPVRFVFTSDVEEEVHVHGYDEVVQLNPHKPAIVEFTADIPGIFEVELHKADKQLVSLEVRD